MKPLGDCKLYTFVDTAYLNGREPEVIAQQLCDGGSDLIQLRAKEVASGQVRRMVEAILPITQRYNVGLVINDHPDIALEMGAELCHVGQEDFFGKDHQHVSELKKKNLKLKVGLSTHEPVQGQRAMTAGADYIAVGPVYPTATKPGVQAAGLDYVHWAAANVRVPWFAIGGINLHTLEDVLTAGARRICVVSAILNAEDIPSVCRMYKSQLA